jgi:choice-of-anchor A domain-containing protein
VIQALRSIFAPTAKRPAKRRVQLQLETLEDRTVPTNLSLGLAGQFTALSLTGTSDIISGPSGVHGDYGVGPKGVLNISGSSFASGTVSLNTDGNPADNAALITSGSAWVGSVVNTDLTGAVSDALAASATYAGLTPTQTFGDVTAPTTIVGNGGTNVISARSINLSGSTILTLSGGANDVFIINVTGALASSGSGTIRLVGGVLPSQVLFNALGSGGGAMTVNLSGTSVFEGTILAPHRDFSIGPATLDGAVICGGSTLQVHSGAQVTTDLFSPPVAATASLSGFVTDTKNLLPIQGVKITLTQYDSTGTMVVATFTTMTDYNGFYSFGSLAAGKYSVSEDASTLPPGYLPTGSSPGTVDGVSPDGTSSSFTLISGVTLAAGNAGINYDFVAIQPIG